MPDGDGKKLVIGPTGTHKHTHKRRGQPVSENAKRGVRRGWRQGKLGTPKSKGPSCTYPRTSLTGMDEALTELAPFAIETLANGAWQWRCMGEHWFEPWVPKAKPGEDLKAWLSHRDEAVRTRYWVADGMGDGADEADLWEYWARWVNQYFQPDKE